MSDPHIPPDDPCICPACDGSGNSGSGDYCGFCGGSGGIPVDVAERLYRQAAQQDGSDTP